MIVFAFKDCQNIVYTQWPMHHALITNDEKPSISDTPLMAIVRKGHWACGYRFPLQRRATLWLYIGTTISLLTYPTYKTKNLDTPLTLNFRMGQAVWGLLFCLQSQPILHVWMVSADRQADYQWCKTINRWRSVDDHFAMAISTISYHLFWVNRSSMVFWQPLYHLHILSPSSKHCSWIIHINIPFKIYFKVSANCRS